VFSLLLFVATSSFGQDVTIQTFDEMKQPEKRSTGFILKKGWQKNVVIKEVKAQAALPRHFDWREQGTLTPVFDQGNCGSCWAQATVTVFQDVMALKGLGNITLSRQYLVSCNKEGWSCQGGFFAHEYHKALPMGAVPEAEFPYAARDLPCKENLSHPYHITSWAYLPSVNENTPPTVEAIKNAIYTFGPVAVGVGASNAFTAYSSGIFNKCDNTQPNHAVVLIGWDDDGQYWILKNSWGNWGEQGHMKIKYGCNYVGLAANYIVFNSPSPNPDPKPTPPPPVPKCEPEPYANAGGDIKIRRNTAVRIGTPARPATVYRWESSLPSKIRFPDRAQIVIRPNRSQILTVYATTKCGTAKSSALVIVN
jgi:hypothetical protein